MSYFVYFIVYFVRIILSLLQFLMLARAVMSWFVRDEGSKIYDFLYYATEPAVYPVRWLLGKFGLSGDSMMIDISFLVTVILLSLVQIFLPAVSF
ncbi:MAG: YggT family protein [Ruminococcaceae bacterium]|nr:YggT family protein [Oscillospiraceae bacterium]